MGRRQGQARRQDALADIEAKPDDQRPWAALEVQLEKALKEDPEFRDELARLIEAIPAEQRMAIQQITNITGDRNVTTPIAGSGNQVYVGPRS